MPRVDNRQLLPQRVLLHLLPNKILQVRIDHRHKLRPRGDTIGVKNGSFINLDALFNGFLAGFGGVLCRTETTGALLIHLGSGRHPIDGDVEEFLGFDDLRDDPVDIVPDVFHHFFLCEALGDFLVVGVGAGVDDAVHVQVEVVEFGEEGQVGDDVVDGDVALGEPAVEFGDAHFLSFSVCGWVCW